MKKLKSKLAAFVITCAAALPVCADISTEINLDNVKKAMEKVYRPFNSDMMFLDVNGEVFIASDNARFLIRPKTGVVYDLWYKTKVETTTDLQEIPRIHIDKLSMNVDTLNVYRYGDPSKPKVHVFIDPIGPVNRMLFEQVDQLKNEFYFKFIVVPGMDKLSVEATEKLACLEDVELGIQSLKSQDYSKIQPSQNVSCKRKVMVQTSTFASVLKIRNLPTIISPRGDIKVALKGGLPEFLEAN